MVKLKHFYTVTILLLAISCTRELPEKPNILFITTDYQAWEDIPALSPVLDMPAIDRLYNEGVVFTNHYCTAPVCMPSRYTLVSGTYPHTHGMWDNGSQWLPEGSPVLMEELGNAGYETIGIGKMHFKPWDRMAGFDERIIADCQGNWFRDTTKHDDYYYYLKEAGMTRFDYLRYQDSTDLFGVYYWPFADSLDIDYYVGEQSVRFIDDSKLPDKPWFMWVSFNGPHNPWDPPKEYMDYYLERELPVARYMEDELEKKPFAHTITRYNYTRKVVDRIDMDPENRESYIHRIRAGHYGGLSLIDRQIDRIISKLKEKDELENTIIIFTSDHGAHLGDHNLIHKGTHYERSSHVPFIIWWPEALKPGKVKGYTSHVDIFPTLIDLAGGTKPEGLEGYSYLALLKKEEKAPESAIIEIIGNTALVNDKYKFGLYRQFKEGDLYDRKADPDEFNNLYYDPDYQEVVKELTEYLLSKDPTLKEGLENAPKIKDLPVNVNLEQGSTLAGRNCPYLGGRSFGVSMEFSFSHGNKGPLLCNYEEQHGFSIYIENETLMAGFRKWNNDKLHEISHLEPGDYKMVFGINDKGWLSVRLNGEEIAEKQTIWPKPVQPGRKEYLTGSMHCGHSGSRNSSPVGGYKPGSEYTGLINKCSLSINK